MTKEKKDRYTSYQSIPQRARFWLHSEDCYTEEELKQRSWMIKARANSGIHPDYLTNPSSWFAEDKQALINAYQDSWFYSNAFKTTQVLTQDDFHVQPIDSQRLQWPVLYDLMQKTGDYLLLRNHELPQEHLNQPMNFILLDLNYILKGISQNPNIMQTQEQLTLLTRYLRTLEKHISPLVGSDRLFLANVRSIIDDEVHPQLTYRIESQLLKDHLYELSKTIKQISIERNRILHFSLNINKVNPHPYDFDIEPPQYLEAYPTQAAKVCGENSAEISENLLSVLKLTLKQLRDCPNFRLITMHERILEYYSQAITDLNDLTQFQKIIAQTIDLLGQAGEVYTIEKFKEQLTLMLQQIELFINESSLPIDAIIRENSNAYHQAIYDRQNLSFLTKWLSSEKEKLNNFIHNQDTLAQFPSTSVDLLKTSKTLKDHVSQIMAHLNQPKIKEAYVEKIAGRAQELNSLMNSMHHWIKFRYIMKGLIAPKAPEILHYLTQPSTKENSPSPEPSLSFFPGSNALNITDYLTSDTSEANNHLFYLGLIILIPIGILMLYLLCQSQRKVEGNVLDNQEKADELALQINLT